MGSRKEEKDAAKARGKRAEAKGKVKRVEKEKVKAKARAREAEAKQRKSKGKVNAMVTALNAGVQPPSQPPSFEVPQGPAPTPTTTLGDTPVDTLAADLGQMDVSNGSGEQAKRAPEAESKAPRSKRSNSLAADRVANPGAAKVLDGGSYRRGSPKHVGYSFTS